MGQGGELERALVDVTGTGKTVRSCREKRFEKKLYKRRLNSPFKFLVGGASHGTPGPARLHLTFWSFFLLFSFFA